MSEWEIISEQRAPQTMPPPMSPPAVDNEWEVVSEREAPNAMPPPTASGGWEIIREEPASQSAWAPSLDTVNIPEYGDIDPYAYADLKPADIVGEQAPRKGGSVPVALGKAAASAIPAWGKSVGGMVRATEEASLGTPLTLSSDIAATITSPLKALKGKEYEGVDEFGQPMKMSLDWLSAVPEAYRNFAGWIRKKLPDIMNAPIIGSVEKAMGLDKSIGQTTGEYWSGIERQWQPEVEKGSLLADVTGAVASVAQVAPGIVASIITKNPNIALNTFFATTLGQTYEDIREKKPDLAPSQALAGGIISGAAEKYTEKLPLEALLNPKWGFWKRLFANMGLEVPGEEIATIVQSGIVEKATTNPDMNVKEFLQMLRDTAVQTLIASPMQVAISHPLIKYVERQEKKIAEQEQQQASQPSPAAITPENLRWLVENRETLGLSDDDVAPYLKIIENATPRPTEELSGVREKMKAGEATPEEVIDAYSSKLDDIAGLMQEKEATALESRRGRYETPGQTALDFGTAGTPLFDETTQPSPATEKTQPAATSEGEGATKEPWQMVPAEYVGDAARDEKAVKLAAHPMHVKRALEEGKTVPLEVLDKYRNNYWAQKAIERLHGEAALKEPEAGYGEAGLDNVSKTKDNAAMSKDKGTGAIPAKDNPTPGTGAKYNQRAIRKYGLATADESIGFITRDGRGIDSSGRRQGSSSQGRNIDHRQIAQDALGDDGIADGWTKNMRLFMNRTGNIRVVGAKGEVNIDIPIKVGMPTNKQLSVIKRLAAEKKIYYDFTDESGNSVFSGEGPYGKFIKDLAGTIQNESEINSAKSAGEIPRQLKPMADFIRENNLTKEQFQDIRYNDKNPLHETMNKLMDRASLGINKVWDDFGFNHQGEFYDRVAQTIPNPSRPPEVGGQVVPEPGQVSQGKVDLSQKNLSRKTSDVPAIYLTDNPGEAYAYAAGRVRDAHQGQPKPTGGTVIEVGIEGERDIGGDVWQSIKEDIQKEAKSGDLSDSSLDLIEKAGVEAKEVAKNPDVIINNIDPFDWLSWQRQEMGYGELALNEVPWKNVIRITEYDKNGNIVKQVQGGGNPELYSVEDGNILYHGTPKKIEELKSLPKELSQGKVETPVSTLDSASKEADNITQEGKLNEPEKEYRDNADLASQAISELQRPQAVSSVGMRDRGRTDGGEPVRVPGEKAGGAEGVSRRIITLAKTVSDLKELKSIRLRGTEAATWNAVYDALRIVRNANVEILNVLYRGKTSGTILYNEAYSCRLPGSVENVNASLLAMNAVGEANKLSRIHKEEVEIIFSHNHPSGDVTVSEADRKFTKEAAAAVSMSKGSFAGHIVINHNKYSLVDAQGKAKPFNLPDVPEEYRNDPLLTMPVPHKALGKSATMPDHIALVARDIQRGEHYFTVLLRAGTKIRGIVNVPLDILNDKKAATEFIHELAVQHGAQDVFAYREDFTNEQKGTLINMVKENTFRDVVYDAGNVAGYFPADRRKIFGKDRTTIEAQRLEGVPQEVKGKGAVRQVDAWHGSPHTFNKFKSEKIGIGEGNQSFGWGLYFTDLEDVARHYAEKLGYGADIAINGKPIRKGENAFLAALSTDLAQATMLSSNTKAKQVAQIYIDSAIDRLENNLPYTGTKAEQAEALKYLKSMGRVESIEKKHSRNLYKVTLHKGKQLGEYNWLEWDKEVPDSIYKKMEDSISPIQEMKGRSHQLIDLLKWTISRKGPYSNKGSELYKELAKEYGSDKEASLFLLRAGIDGIKYPAGSLSGMKTDASNYVVFDENAVTVEQHSVFEKEGEYGEEEAPYGEEEEDDSFDFGANIEKAIEENPEKHISLDFKDHLEGYIGHLFNMVVAGEPGKRLTLEGMGGQDQVVSWGSTYPEFMKGQGWSAKEVLAALRHAQAGEKTTDKQKEIIRAALHQATDMFFEDMDRWAPNLSEEALEKMEASIEPAIDDFLSKYYREKREREIERQKIARTTKITKSQYDWEREKQKAKEGAWMKGFKSRQEEVNALQSELAKTEAKLQTQIAHVRKLFEGEKIKEGAWKEAERIKNTEIKTLQGEIKRLKDRLAKAKEEAAPKPKVKRMSRKGQIRIVTGQVLANEEINLREMDALKSQIRMEAAAAREAYRAGNKAGLAKARARYQSMKDILRIKRAQQADIRKMIKQMKDVAKKADQLPPEYKLAITDLLEPWDMARLTDKNRVKLQAIRNEMETNKDADFPPSMLETLKRLDKRPIRDLSYDEIQSIHRAVMHFATLGRNKIKGMAAQQRIVREMTRGVVKGEMKEAEAGSDNYDIRYSDEKKIKGFLQKAKNQFGIHLIGWEALVESVSGPRSMFYKAIYRNIKEGTIERDKAMYELEDLFLKAQDAFQQKHGIKDIADWLDADRTIEYVSGKTITMSRNQLISLELGWRDADWRRSVEEGGFGLWNNPMPNDPNRVYQLGPEGIEKIIAAVTPTEREYADMAVPIIQKTGDMLADKFLEINGYEMPRTESGAYWRKDVMASERGKTDEQTELEKARLGRPGIFKGMTIQRTGDSSAVWLKPFTVAMREMSKRGADYVALEEPMSLAAWLMYDKEFRKEFDKRYGMPLWKEIEQGLKDLSDTYQPVRDTTWERVGTWLRNKSTLFALGLNYATMLKQFTGAINYLVYVDPVHLANAIVKYGTNRNDVRRLHKQMSTEYRHRREEGYSQDVGNVITSLSATGQKPSLVTRIGVAGMRPLQAIDIFGVDIGMLAAVDQALDAFKAGKLTEDMKDALDMSDEDIKGMTYAEQFEAAYKWADYCTERTQNMSRPEHMSGWQRGSEFSKQFSMFMGEVQKNLTGLYRAYNKVQRGDIGAHMHLTKNILLYLVVSSLIIDAGVNAMRDILRGRRPDRWWAVGLKAITSPIPIIRDITQTAVDTAQGKGFWVSGGDTPMARVQESIPKIAVKGTKAITAKTATERKEAALAAADALANTAALTTGLPYPAIKEPFRIAKREETARKERQRNR